ncbi:MAG: DUF362 domain-containing protein [Deltaproteobacteria bacterium]|nr:DUF362 domain-containing protein [Deltaproteobacteria bacterium]MBW2136035.1 DUF362 domain-containing protein [Deltaproteobacteria bacterium]
MTKVALLGCREYDASLIRDKILEGLSLIEADTGVFSGARVLVKPNLLSASLPEKAIVTHPEFFRAAIQAVKVLGGYPVLIESPAFQSLEKVMKKTRYKAVVEEEGCEIADTKDTEVLFHEAASRYRRFDLPKALFAADIVLNLPKFKTHGLTYITGAVKNLFGLIHGLKKSQWHVKARDKEAFSNLLLDLYEVITKGLQPPKRFLHVMDAVVAMEGDGPGSSGSPKEVGAMLVGEDAIALDSIMVTITGLDRDKALTLAPGEERGLGIASLERIDVRGLRLGDFFVDTFKPSLSNPVSRIDRWPMNTRFLRDLLIERPLPLEEKCTLCYQCKAICPAGAIERSDGRGNKPLYDYDGCVRCLCCMEICPEGAITVKKGRLQGLLDRWAT